MSKKMTLQEIDSEIAKLQEMREQAIDELLQHDFEAHAKSLQESQEESSESADVFLSSSEEILSSSEDIETKTETVNGYDFGEEPEESEEFEDPWDYSSDMY